MTEGAARRIHDSRYCGGKKRQGEGLCTRPAGWGTDHPGAGRCKLHGGCAPSGAKAGRDELVEREARKLMDKLELASALSGRPVDNPLTELALLAGRARALMETLEERVEALLNADAGTEETSSESENGIRYRAGPGEQIRGEMQLYERAMDRLGRLLVDIARLNIDERLAKITERQIDAVLVAFEAGLNAAGIRDPAQRSAAKQAAGRALELVKSA